MEPETVAAADSALADRYVALFGSVSSVDADDLRIISAHLGGAGLVLDLGCGPGHLSGFLAATGADVLGVDVVPEFVAHARAHHPGVRFELVSFAPLTRPDASATGVLCWFSLIHTEPDDLDAALRGIARVAAPGAQLVVGFFEGPVCEPFEHKVVRAYRWPVDEFAARLAAAGFAEVERAVRPRKDEQRPYAVLAATRVP